VGYLTAAEYTVKRSSEKSVVRNGAEQLALPKVYDVAIVGFGPSGAIAAALLGQAGLSVLVLDQATSVYEKPRAISMDHEIMRVLQGVGVAEAVQPFTEPFSPSEHFGADGQLIRRLAMLEPPYPLGWTPSMVFLQPPVEKILRQRVSTLDHVDVLLGQRLVKLTQTNDQCNLECETQSGHLQSYRARYTLGCDGASSVVRQLVGIELEDLGFDEPWLVVDVLANANGLAKLPKASAQFCEPARPASYLIGTGSHRRWEIMLLPGEDPKQMERDENVWKLLSRWITSEDATLWRQASYRFHALVAKEWRKGRVFIAGDAAHQQPPFLGQGMCQGIRDVSNLAWKLQQVIAGNASDRLLDTYATERAAHVRQLTATIKIIGSSICERDPIAARERDERLITAAGGTVKTVPRQDLIPGLTGGLCSPYPHPAVGSLFPQPRVKANNEVQLLDDAVGSGWRLILTHEACTWAVELPNRIEFLRIIKFDDSKSGDALIETEGVLQAWLERHQCRAIIVRPDHYVYGVANNAQALGLVLASLEHWFS
jgi:3-(3-hydroxy-phenyl)propionate hydroxylase